MAGRSIECAHCGIQFSQSGRGRPRKYCSRDCLWIGSAREKGVRPIEDVKRERREAALKICEQCGGRFLQCGGNAGRFCSRECSIAAQSGSGIQPHVRAIMNELARWARPNRVLGYASRIALLRKRIERKGWACVTCGSAVEQSPVSGRKRYCSKKCRPIDLELKAKHKRIAKAKRRARKRGADCETVDPFKVFERDGWLCHLCGCKTDRTRRGSWHAKAPELDHIVPLSQGGPHNYANTACSCRKCNHAKGDRIIGQPSLLAA